VHSLLLILCAERSDVAIMVEVDSLFLAVL
jgi:hypothetical protein